MNGLQETVLKETTLKAVPSKGNVKAEMGPEETREERARRLYAAKGGPLVGWLLDEARRRRQNFKAMSRELGVTYGYIHQLATGLRSTAHISQEFADLCGRYLGVPTVVVKLIAGDIRMSDFAFRQEDEEAEVDRALRQVQDDPQVRQAIPQDLLALPLAAKKAVLLMHSRATGHPMLGLRELPLTVRWLQRAAVVHNEAEIEVLNG
jgi:hypothetical protein